MIKRNGLAGSGVSRTQLDLTDSSEFAGRDASGFRPQNFVTYFERNYARPRPQLISPTPEFYLESVSPLMYPCESDLSGAKRAALKTLIDKLAFGELAEGQMGRKLLKLTQDETDRQTLNYYTLEEQRHAEELFALAEHLNLGIDTTKPDKGGQRVVFLTRFLNWGRLVDVANLILVGEVLILALYRELATRIDHSTVERVVRGIIRDEAGHLRYHGERVRCELKQAGWLNRAVLWAVHQFSLALLLFSAYALLRPDLKVLTGLGWKELLKSMESDYNGFFKGEMRFFRNPWFFRLFRLLP